VAGRLLRTFVSETESNSAPASAARLTRR
jgi:hypothetical protein